MEAWEGEFGGGAGAADGGVGLEDVDGEAGAREDGSGGEAVWSGADDDGSFGHGGLRCAAFPWIPIAGDCLV